jgi:hypothetical protein
MRCFRPRVLLSVLLVVVACLHAAEKPYLAGRLVDVQKKTRDRVLYYLVNTPVSREEPYYEVFVRVQNTIYVGEYTPVHASESLPQDWVPGAEVQVRIVGHRLFLARPEGTELGFAIVKHTHAAAEAGRSGAKPNRKGRPLRRPS